MISIAPIKAREGDAKEPMKRSVRVDALMHPRHLIQRLQLKKLRLGSMFLQFALNKRTGEIIVGTNIERPLGFEPMEVMEPTRPWDDVKYAASLLTQARELMRERRYKPNKTN